MRELYNLRTDPHELNNLAADPSHADVIYKMAARLRGWQQRTDDRVPINVG